MMSFKAVRGEVMLFVEWMRRAMNDVAPSAGLIQ
jgi:hypothetical protein